MFRTRRRNLTLINLFLSSIFLSTYPSWAQDFNKGLKYYSAGDFTAAFSELYPLADTGDADAQLLIGTMYYKGEGVDADSMRAVEWLSKSANQDQADAQASLGSFYINGIGVPQSYREAVYWSTMAAENGGAQGQLLLGTLYSQGQGVPKDKIKAHMWLNLAASQGLQNATLMRDLLTGMMTTEEISNAQAMAISCVSQNYTNC